MLDELLDGMVNGVFKWILSIVFTILGMFLVGGVCWFILWKVVASLFG